MQTVNQYTPMKSGDQFLYEKDTPQCCLYTLQKLPDFPLWILVSEFNNHWCRLADTSFGAFGNWESKFVKVE